MKTILLATAVFTAMSVLAYLNWAMTRSPVQTDPITGQALPRVLPAADALEEVLKIPEISLAQASQRPLFAPDRRPWMPPPQPPVAVPASIQSETPAAPPVLSFAVTMLGIQKTPNGSTVLLKSDASLIPIWVKEGEFYESWLVRNISVGTVDLANGDVKLTLELHPAAQNGTMPP